MRIARAISHVCVYISFTNMIKHFIYSKLDQSKTIKGTKGAGSFVVLSQFCNCT